MQNETNGLLMMEVRYYQIPSDAEVFTVTTLVPVQQSGSASGVNISEARESHYGVYFTDYGKHIHPFSSTPFETAEHANIFPYNFVSTCVFLVCAYSMCLPDHNRYNDNMYGDFMTDFMSH